MCARVVGSLTRLRSLGLTANRIDHVNDAIGNLRRLETLLLGSAPLEELCAEPVHRHA